MTSNIDSREGFSSSEQLAYEALMAEQERALQEEYEEYLDSLDDEVRYYDDATECEYEFDDDDDDEYARDLMLEQQEREDFCECDESYGCYGGEDW